MPGLNLSGITNGKGRRAANALPIMYLGITWKITKTELLIVNVFRVHSTKVLRAWVMGIGYARA